MNEGDSGEPGFSMSPGLGDEGGVSEPGFIVSPAPRYGDVDEPGFSMSPARTGGLRGVWSNRCGV